jgi:hypothetical protein
MCMKKFDAVNKQQHDKQYCRNTFMDIVILKKHLHKSMTK